MPIIQKNDINNNKYFCYEKPHHSYLFSLYNELVETYHDYTDKIGVARHEARFDSFILGKITVRLDQRCEYYMLYHNNLHLSEIRRAGILAYWVIKYRPFDIKMSDQSKWQNKININETMAYHIILGKIAILINLQQTMKLSTSAEYKKRLIHAFKEHDISKESMMLIAESLFEKVY